MESALRVFEEIQKLSNPSNKKLTDVNIIKLDRDSDVIFVLLPEWAPNLPPYNIARLSSILNEAGYKSSCLDLNIETYQESKKWVKKLGYNPFNPNNLATNQFLTEEDYQASEHLKRFQDTQVKMREGNQISDASNDQDLVSVIATLKSKLYQESIKSKHYTNAFNELNERLIELEKIVQPEKKTDFQKLQGWVHSKRHFH